MSMSHSNHTSDVISRENYHEEHLMQEHSNRPYASYFENEYEDENEQHENEDIYYEDENQEKHLNFKNQSVNRKPFDGHSNMNPPEEEYYQEEHCTMYETQGRYSDLDNENILLTALQVLAQDENNIENEVVEAEQENTKISTAVSSANTFAKEELLILNENFALLTTKSEEKKRYENLYNEKIVKTRNIIVSDISDKIQPEVKRLFRQLGRNKAAQIENRKTINLKFLEANNKVEQNSQHIKNIEDEIKERDLQMKDVDKLLIEKETFEQEEIKIKTKQEEPIGRLQQIQKDYLTAVTENNGLGLELLENESETQTKGFSIEHETIKQEKCKLDDLVITADEEIKEFNTNIQKINKENEENVNKQEISMKENEEKLHELQNLNLQTNHLQLEKFKNENIVDKESNDLVNITFEREGICGELNAIEEEIVNELTQGDYEMKQNVSHLTETLNELENTMDMVLKEHKDLDKKINEISGTMVESKLSELTAIKYNNAKEYDVKINKFKNHFEESELNEKEARHNLEITKSEIEEKENKIVDTINQMKNQIEDLKIDVNNSKSIILHVEQELAHNKETSVLQLKSLNDEKDFLKISESTNHEFFKKNESEIQENLKNLEQKLYNISIKMDEYQATLNTIKKDINEISEKEIEQNQKNIAIEKILQSLIENFKNIDLTLENESLFHLEKDMSSLNIQIQDVNHNIEKEKKSLNINKNTCDNLIEKVKVMKNEKTTLYSLNQEIKGTISTVKVNYEDEKVKLILSLSEKQKHAQHSLEQMKKSYENKLVFHSKETNNLKEKCKELNNTREQILEDIKRCEDTERELQAKIEKRQGQIETYSSGVERIRKILQQSGFQDYDKYFIEFD